MVPQLPHLFLALVFTILVAVGAGLSTAALRVWAGVRLLLLKKVAQPMESQMGLQPVGHQTRAAGAAGALEGLEVGLAAQAAPALLFSS